MKYSVSFTRILTCTFWSFHILNESVLYLFSMIHTQVLTKNRLYILNKFYNEKQFTVLTFKKKYDEYAIKQKCLVEET